MWKTEARRGLLDVRLPIPGGLAARIIERPGIRLEPPRLEELLRDLRGVADRCVGPGLLRYGLLSGDPKRLADAVVAALYRRDSGEMLAFNAMVALEVELSGSAARIVHTGLCLIDESLRSRGLCVALTAAPAILAYVRNGFRPLWFTNVTQVPAATGVFATALEDVYPAPGRAGPPSAEHREIVASIVGRHRAAFGVGDDADLDERAFVIRNSYTGGSDALKKDLVDCAKHRDERYNAWCATLLDYERGDDVIQVGRMTGRQWARVLLRLLRGVRPRRSRYPARRPAWLPTGHRSESRA